MSVATHEAEMADMLLAELANDGVRRSWDEIKRQAALQLEAMGLTEMRAAFAVQDAIRFRGEGIFR